MHARLRSEATVHCVTNSTVEVCGLAVQRGDGSVVLQQCGNVSASPFDSFEIGTEDHIKAARTGRTLWAYHSHPRGPGAFSEADLESAEETGLIQWMRDGTTGRWHEHIPATHPCAPLEGRPFVWGEADCYSLIRDYYRTHHRIALTDYPRDEDSPWATLGAMVMDGIAREGFTQLPAGALLRKHDILIFRTNGSPQHFAIFTGNSTVLHHPMGALSRKDQFNAAWQRRLHCVARYSGRQLG